MTTGYDVNPLGLDCPDRVGTDADPVRGTASGPATAQDLLSRRAGSGAPTGRIFNIQRFSTEDGPGIRTTVFLKGCPLLCSWCANPESQKGSLEIAHSDPLCDGCGRCVPACTRGAIALHEGKPRIDRSLCDDCGACIPVCGPRALRMMGEDQSVDQVFDEVRKDVSYYRNSGGGVSCSGGEPLTQSRFVAALFERCHGIGLHTTLDTCGLAPRRALDRVLEHTDLVLFDLKAIDSRHHEAITGMPNEQILENARRVAESDTEMIARVPLIPGLTDGDDNIRDIARFVRWLGKDVPVNVLPYHRFGMNKYAMLDRAYDLGDAKPLTEERIREIVACFESLQLRCEIVT